MTEPAARAEFSAKGAGAPSGSLKVQFNPSSLKLTISNTMQDDQPGSTALQSVRKSATKLDLELLFDTTDSGGDVRGDTSVLKQMGRPAGTKNPALPMVTFSWGLFSFTGVIDSLQETIDFFSAEGVPLRSTVQLSMQSLDLDTMRTKAPTRDAAAAGGGDGGAGTSVAPPPPDGKGATDTATRAGNPAAGRALAAANGLASMRFTAGAGLAVGADVQLLGPVGFSAGASAGAGFGISGGAGFGASAGASFGASAGAGFGVSSGAGIGISGGAGFSASASAGFSGSASAGFGSSASAGFNASAGVSFGGSASAGVSASAGAFSGLGVSKSVSTSFTLDPDRLRAPVATFSFSADATASFDATGRAVTVSSSGLRADTGASASITIR